MELLTTRALPELALAGMLLALGLITASKGGLPLAAPQPAEIPGRLTYNGDPLGSVSVVLVPAGQPGRGQAAVGDVRWDGSFALRAVPEGRYDIFIHRPESWEEVHAASGTKAGVAGQRPGTIPTRFTARGTSGLTISIGPRRHRIDRIEIALRD
jgi:hypothetical protein